MNKILSIAVAAYQVEAYLEQTLLSMLLPEIMDDIEILVVDDGSTDGTTNIASHFQERYPDTVRFIRQENGGHGAAVERGIQEASALYFKTIDGDDWVDKKGIIALVQYLKQCDRVDVVCTPYEWVDHNTGKPIKKFTCEFDGCTFEKIYSFTEVCDEIYVNMHAMTCRTRLIQECMPPIDHHCFYVDAEYVLLPVPYIQTIAFLGCSVYQYRLGTDGQSMNLHNMQKNCSHHERVLERILDAYKEQRETTVSMWKHGAEDEVDRQAALCRYLAKGAAKLAASQMKIYLSFPASSKEKDKILRLDTRLRQGFPEVYEANTNRAVNLLRRSRYRLYPLASRMVRRKL